MKRENNNPSVVFVQHIQGVESANAEPITDVGARNPKLTGEKRLASIDVLRGTAVLLMVETHVFNVCLNELYKGGWLYNTMSLLNGFVSVAFLFCAGAGFWMTIAKKRESLRRAERPLWLYVRRLLFILLLAYWLHLPTHSLAMLRTMSVEQWSRVFQFDILHTIVVGLLACISIALLPLRTTTLRGVFAVLAVGCFAVTPAVWQWHPEHLLPLSLAMPFMAQPISKFPLFPWCGYLFAGVAIAGYIVEARQPKRVATALAIGCSVAAAVVVNAQWSYSSYGGMWWFVAPEHSLYRLLGVAAVFGAFFSLESPIARTRIGQMLSTIGQESLGFYMVHLVLVYGSVLNPGIAMWLKGSLTPLALVAVIAVVVLVTYGIVMVWRNLKQRDSKRAQHVLVAFAVLFVVVFLLAPTY